MEKKLAECTIVWNDTKESENVTISIYGSDNDSIFFVCQNEAEFMTLTKEGNGEDFIVIEYEFV